MKSFAIVLGLSPTGLYVVRELGMAGIAVTGIDASLQAGSYSRYLAADLGAVLVEDEGNLLTTVKRIAERIGGRGVLIPTSDTYIEWIVQNGAALAGQFDFQASYCENDFASIVNKGGFSKLCSEYNIAAPRQWEGSTEDLPHLSREVIYPCLVKPTLFHRVKEKFAGRKVMLAADARALTQIARSLEGTEGRWLIQEIIPGPESNITLFGGYFSSSGSLQQAFTARKLRQFPPGFGSASLARSETLPETLAISEHFLKSIGFRGIASSEFKYDSRDKTLKILEINPRPGLWYALSHHARKRISLAAYQDLAGLPAPPEEAQQDGLVWRYWMKDLYAAAFYQWKGRGFVLPPPAVSFGRTIGPLLDFTDIKPVMGEAFNYANKLIQRSFKKR